MKKIYISGAITNNPNYKFQFKKKYEELDGAYTVLSPLMINAPLSWKDYMHIDLAMIKICDAIYMLHGWEESKGARIEHCFAQILGLEIIYEDTDEEIRKSCWNCEFRFRNGERVPCSTCRDGSDYKYRDWSENA